MQMTEDISELIEAANEAGCFFCKFISANDVGINGAHQEGIYLAKSAWDLFFPGVKREKGKNIEKMISVHMEGYYKFPSRLIYYGKGTRDEYRITRFWTNSPYDKSQHVGDLIVFVPVDKQNFKVYLLSTEAAIDSFIEHFAFSLVKNSAVYNSAKGQETAESQTIEQVIEAKASEFDEFPDTATMAGLARQIYNDFHGIHSIDADKHILNYIDTEYSVYRAIEKKVYQFYLEAPFESVDELLRIANSALNRRKSRAGKSLEHHMSYIFKKEGLPFENPGKTEGNKKPDFLFPSNEAYADTSYEPDNLTFLGAKTTCKDRWRQVLNEANRIPRKFLLTLQQGITVNQLNEMETENLTLVVPAAYHRHYPKSHQGRLWTINQFLSFVHEKYQGYY